MREDPREIVKKEKVLALGEKGRQTKNRNGKKRLNRTFCRKLKKG